LHQLEYPTFIVISILSIIVLILSGYVYATPENNAINIISPSNNSQVQAGNLTITGTAVYDSSLPCSVYATWNNSQTIRYPANIVNDGKNYSMWKFTFDPKSHQIIAGPNTLIGILSCANLNSENLTSVSSIKVNGIEESYKENDLFQDESEFSDMIPTTGLNNPQERGDVFSSKNFGLTIPFTKENETRYDSPITNEFERVNRTNMSSTMQHNNTPTSAVPPSILEIESNQNSNISLLYSNDTRITSDAGPDQTVYEGTSVILNGSNSKSNNNVILSYEWKQIPNPSITIGGADTMIWYIMAPYVGIDTTLTFELVVTDDKGITSADEVNINVRDGNDESVGEAEMTDEILEKKSQNSKNDTSTEPRNLIIQTLVDENPISTGEQQVIKIDLIDPNSDDRINNATIVGQILDSSENEIKEFSEDNDSFELSLDIPEDAEEGNFVIRVNATAPGYISSNTDTNFEVEK
jgi:hypothetical protein